MQSGVVDWHIFGIIETIIGIYSIIFIGSAYGYRYQKELVNSKVYMYMNDFSEESKLFSSVIKIYIKIVGNFTLCLVESYYCYIMCYFVIKLCWYALKSISDLEQFISLL